MIFPLQEGPVSQTDEFKQSLNRFNVTDSPLSVTNIVEMALFYLNWPVLMIFPLQDGPVSQTGEFKQSLDRFYVTDSPLCVTITSRAWCHHALISTKNGRLKISV